MNHKTIIAPCGMNCGICMAYLRTKKKCPGCRNDDIDKSASCINCKIKNCGYLSAANAKYCYECVNFPCGRLKHLDKRYRARYDMSMIENLANIKKFGIMKFLKTEKDRWACPGCGGTINVHRKVCSNCGR